MAHMKHTPKNYAQAVEALAGRDSVKLGNNTWLLKSTERTYSAGALVQESNNVVVRLHNTEIVKFFEDGRITLHTGGYRTVTTKDRINQFISGRVYQKDHVWYHRNGESTLEFYEGLDVSVIGN